MSAPRGTAAILAAFVLAASAAAGRPDVAPQAPASDGQSQSPAAVTSAGPPVAPARAALSGRVVTDDGQPVGGASVTLYPAGSDYGSTQRGDADDDGKFAFDGLAPSAYLVEAEMPGYVEDRPSGERPTYRTGGLVTLRMTKGGVITGTVRDENDEPVVEIVVRAERVRDAAGRRSSGDYGHPSAATDDRGVYRIYGLESGTYVVSAGAEESYGGPTGPYAENAPVYYPSARRAGASPVAVRAGDEVTGIDIRYRDERGRTVSGTVTNAGTDDVFVSLTRAADGSVETRAYASPRGGAASFVMRGVPDGEYEVSAESGYSEASSAASPPRRVVVRGADVAGIALALAPLGALSGTIVVEPAAGGTRPEACPKPDGRVASEVVVRARRDLKSVSSRGANDYAVAREAAGPDGAFTVARLRAGLYRVEADLPSDDWYVRSVTSAAHGPAGAAPAKAPGSRAVRAPGAKGASASSPAGVAGSTPAGGTGAAAQPGAASQAGAVSSPGADKSPIPAGRDAAGGVALAAGQKLDGITVTVARGAAAVRGSVQLAEGAPAGSRLPAGMRAYLVPAEPDAAGTLVRYYDVAVSGGAFSFANVAPGAYRVVVRAESLDVPADERRPAYWDADARAALRAEAEARGAKVDLAPCQRAESVVARFAP